MTDKRRWLFPKHPAGMASLFVIEVCERMSYYGMAALLVLYLSATLEEGGLGYSEATAKMLFSIYTGAVYLLPLLGGLVADRWLGARRTMVTGAIIIAIGHLLVAFQWLPMFFGGLAVIALGTGLLKPNVNTMLGNLYPKGSELRSAGFNLLYMGINLGAAAAPLVCGFMAQSPTFRNEWLPVIGLHPHHTWHWGFAAAGVAMVMSVVWYYLHRERLEGFGDLVKAEPRLAGDTKGGAGLTADEWKKLGALGFLFVAFTLYCAVSQQSGTSLTTFANKLTNLNVFGWQLQASYTLALNPVFIVAMTPLFAWLWPFLSKRKMEPSDPLKFAFGMAFLALGTFLLVPAARQAAGGTLANPMWLVGVYFFQTVAELLMSPVGNNAATRLAPARFASLTMGVWYTSVALGSFLAGWLSGWCNTANPSSFASLFGVMTAGSVALAAILLALTKPIRRLMGESSEGGPPSGSH